jgi:cytochrome b involved in lipid metabolism
MAPDADKLRQRHPVASDSPSKDVAETGQLCIVKSLKPHEVAIDGVIYDISSFDHPRGESIHIFEGNDATTQYKIENDSSVPYFQAFGKDEENWNYS